MMFRHLRHRLLALLVRDDTPEDPAVLLSQAERAMQEMQAKNRERAIQAITQKNNLQQMVDDTQGRVEYLRREEEGAEARSDPDLARQLRRERLHYETTLLDLETSLAQAKELVEEIKTAVQREEERIQRKTAEALALRAEWELLKSVIPPAPPAEPNPFSLLVALLVFALLLAGLVYALAVVLGFAGLPVRCVVSGCRFLV